MIFLEIPDACFDGKSNRSRLELLSIISFSPAILNQ